MDKKGVQDVVWFLIAFLLVLIVLVVIVIITQNSQTIALKGFEDLASTVKGWIGG